MKTFSFWSILHWQKDIIQISRTLWGLIKPIKYLKTQREDHIAVKGLSFSTTHTNYLTPEVFEAQLFSHDLHLGIG